MSNIDVEIYLSQMKTFFKENPNELVKLLGQANAEDFFDGVFKIATENVEKGDEVQLTNKQMIQLIVDLNKPKQKTIKKEVMVPYINHRFGKIFLN